MTSVMTPNNDGLAQFAKPSLSKTTPWSANSPSNIRIGSRLQLIRESHGISEKELSERLKIKCVDLKLYEAGERRVSANLLLRIVKLLDVRPEYFFQDYARREPWDH